jgi:hypothetical protein
MTILKVLVIGSKTLLVESANVDRDKTITLKFKMVNMQKYKIIIH